METLSTFSSLLRQYKCNVIQKIGLIEKPKEATLSIKPIEISTPKNELTQNLMNKNEKHEGKIKKNIINLILKLLK
jgi:hypothetical protein